MCSPWSFGRNAPSTALCGTAPIRVAILELCAHKPSRARPTTTSRDLYRSQRLSKPPPDFRPLRRRRAVDGRHCCLGACFVHVYEYIYIKQERSIRAPNRQVVVLTVFLPSPLSYVLRVLPLCLVRHMLTGLCHIII